MARTSIPVLIEGETGTGKVFLAQAIHRASACHSEPFELIDCSILSAERLRDELSKGVLVQRLVKECGALCLDSPGSAPLEVQKLLLSLIQSVSNSSYGGPRVLSLSTRSLLKAVNEGLFRSDLYYHIAGARLMLKPLRERQDEIETHLRTLIIRHAEKENARELQFTAAALAALKAYDWPGNLREMSNLIEMMDALSPTGLIDEKSLPEEIRQRHHDQRNETLHAIEKTEILNAIELSDGNLTEAARRLGIARSTLYLKLDSHGVARSRRNSS